MLLALLAATSGCLIPPPLEQEGSDGGPNQRPKIEWDIINPQPGDLTVKQTALGKKRVTQRFAVWVTDQDPQTLFLNVFLNGILDGYTKPIWSDQAPPTSTGKRGFVVDLDGLCDELVNFTLGRHDLEFYISDSGFWTEGERREPNSGGQVVSILWRLQCVLPPGAADSGV